jgi:fumarate reductase flavoprotein subunit
LESDYLINQGNMQTDIVVIGGGGSGLAAALSAAESKVRVIVLEKRHSLGGNTAMAQAFFAAESPAQRRMSIDAPRDTLFRMAMDYSHWRINPRIMRAFINLSGDTVRWLEEKGLEIDRIPNYPPKVVIRTFHFPKGGGKKVIDLLTKGCEELGVRFLKRTSAKKILIDDMGKFTGVIADYGGQEIQINAKCLVIATGGFGGNKELIRQYCPDYSDEIRSMGVPNMGDGLLMAREIGALEEGMGTLQYQGPIFEGARNARGIGMEPDTVWVNNKGERFTDETTAENHFESVNAILQQPHKVSYTLFDERIKQNIIERIKNGFIPYRGLSYHANRELSPELSDELNIESVKGRVCITDSWEVMARWIEARPETLIATINAYNEACNRGYDEVFNKDRRYLVPLSTPPFYGLRCYPVFLSAEGGIMINHRMEVLNRNYNPIVGVYAVGNDASGWEPRDHYNAILSGHAFGFALNSGRIAGQNAANSILNGAL